MFMYNYTRRHCQHILRLTQRSITQRRMLASPVAPQPHEGAAAVLLRELTPGGAPFLDAPRPFAYASMPNSRHGGGRQRSARAPTLLINGCGRSGTHALGIMLRRNGVSALHEGRGHDGTVGWPYVGHLDGNWKEYWPMSNQPIGNVDVYEPIFKVHRHPLTAVRSIAAGLTSSGGCRNGSERRWDARAWNCATRFVPLPIPRPAIDSQTTCALGRDSRIRLALHYWVKWNLLADRWAAHTFAVETVTAYDLLYRWCAYCTRTGTCACPPVAAEQSIHRNQSAAPRGVPPCGVRVCARKGHGSGARRPKPKLMWSELDRIDPNMTQVARRLALEYGYSV